MYTILPLIIYGFIFALIGLAIHVLSMLLGRNRKRPPIYSRKRYITLLLLLIFTPLNLAGYCYSQKRFYSDEELLRKTIKHSLRNYDLTIERWKEEGDRNINSLKALPRGAELISYSSVDDFIQKNPNCCSIEKFYGGLLGDGGGNGGSYLSAFLFHYHVKIKIYGYALSKTTPNGPIIFYTTNYVSCCGINSDYVGASFSKRTIDKSRHWEKVHFKFPPPIKTPKINE